MKDKNIEKILIEVIQLTKKVNDLCKGLKEENVFIEFTINHAMGNPETIAVARVTQQIDYMKA